MMRTAWLTAPVRDVLHGLERCLDPRGAEDGRGAGYRALALVGLGLVVGWWIYVPVHELLHAFGCWATGGTVERLEIAALYGGALLERVVPFVVAGGEYAGRLSGFDTGGSDAVYLATDLAPFVLTVFPGVWALRRFGRTGRALLYGAALPFALAPFLSLTGDAYEIGSILTTRLPPWTELAEVLRADDVARLAEQLGERDDAPWGGMVLGCALGALWAFLVYSLGGLVALALGESTHENAPVSVTGSASRSSGST